MRSLKVGALLLAAVPFVLGRSAHAQSRGDDLARWLDQRGREIWGELPEPCDDLTFARRVYLDVLGRIPSVSELRDYQNLGDDRRDILVEQLVFAEGPRAGVYRRLSAAHFARQWTQVLLPPGTTTNGLPESLTQFLAENYQNHVPYDELISEFVTIQTPQGAGNYYQLSGALPQNYAGHISRVALGVRIECAQCHDHPFNKWKQRDFWGLAAFYADLGPASPGAKSGSIEYEGTVYPAKVLLSPESESTPSVALRSRLARWLTSSDNPYFSATAVNRFWQQLVGRGLYANVENFDLATPEERVFLDEFGKRFAADGYDIRRLTAGICKSSWYQAASVAESQASPEGFSRTLKTISPNQVFDSLEQSLLLPVSRIDPQSARWAGDRTQLVNRLSETIGETPEDYTSGIPQALLLMNGKITSDAINYEQSRLLRAVVESPFFDQQQRIETLYLAVLSRKPTSRELTALKTYLQSLSTDDERKKGFGEILWALLNSPEFVLCR